MAVAFVLSGGGSLGAVQAGMIRALYERGVTPDLLVATSVGAVNAAFLAGRPPTVATAEALGEIWRATRRDDVFPAELLTGFLGFIGRRNAFLSHLGLRRLLEKHVTLGRLENGRVALHVIAVEVLSGAERRLSSGDAIEAVLASAAIPAVFPPVAWNGEELIDGGVANNTPILHAAELGADEIYVLPTGYACSLQATPRSALGMGLHALSLLMQQRLLIEIRALEHRVRLLVMPPPCPLDVTPADFAHADELIERALENGRRFLEQVPPSGSSVPRSMRELHRHAISEAAVPAARSASSRSRET